MAKTQKNNQIAVIETGGKQYLVKPGEKIQVEKIKAKEGEEVTFDKVLLLVKEGKVQIGKPNLKNFQIKAKVLRQIKGKKVINFKFKSKNNYKRKKGHRQLLTEVEILNF